MSNVREYIKSTKNQICYCEACVSPDGNVFDAIPSHVQFLIRISGESKEDLDKKMPMIAAPLSWLVEYTGWVALWYNEGTGDVLTDDQIDSICQLQISKRISNPYIVYVPKEKSVCDCRGDSTDFEEIQNQRKSYVFTNGKLFAVSGCYD